MKVKIYWSAYGWDIEVDGSEKLYRWNHKEEDMGAKALSEMLSDMGHEVELIEDY